MLDIDHVNARDLDSSLEVSDVNYRLNQLELFLSKDVICMSMGKKEVDATKKNGVALSDDALRGVTGGYYLVTYKAPDRVTRSRTFSSYAKFLNWASEHSDYDIISKENVWLKLTERKLGEWLKKT